MSRPGWIVPDTEPGPGVEWRTKAQRETRALKRLRSSLEPQYNEGGHSLGSLRRFARHLATLGETNRAAAALGLGWLKRKGLS